jgi:hypothetical protein
VDAAAAGREALDPVWLRALAWVEASADVFLIREPLSGDAALSGLKAAGEVGRLAEVVGRAPGLPPAAQALVARLIERSWRSFREGALLAELLDARPDLAGLGALYAPFHRRGLVHEGTRARLIRLWSAPRASVPRASAPGGAPRGGSIQMAADAPWVLALSQADAQRALGFPVPEGRVSELLAATLLGRCDSGPANAAFVSSVAHAALFATDCGARPFVVAPEARAHLRARGPGWMGECLAGGDLDAWAELVLALACVDETAAAGAAEDVLRAAQRPDGSLPGRPRLAYHATLTGALASFAVTVGLARETLPG